MDLRVIVLSLVLWSFYNTFNMSIGDITFTSNCKIDESTSTDGDILALRKSIILAKLSAGPLGLQEGRAGAGVQEVTIWAGAFQTKSNNCE